jgi:HSP20 family molecular chaperone IbpA
MAKHKRSKLRTKHKPVKHKKKLLPVKAAHKFPVNELKTVFSSLDKRFDRLEASLENRFRSLEHELAPFQHKLKLHDGPHSIKAVVSLPEFQKKDVSIHLTDHSLTVSAQGKGASFYRSMTLPFLIVPEKARADFKGGKLTVVLPKYKERVAGGRKITL